ncbi:uncharacterized protein LOC117315232 [Pecten maximus]|uniref:uncharacterized protein LOC117315232 n=1 Tax=Pecten maximus TaxID=6579 RepID=UPI0014589BB3|nr:uncharacterized protein LOC117315232 [Pecten maximus]
MAMFKFQWCIVLALLLDTVQRTYADPKKCVNTPFDLVIASEDTKRVIPGSVAEINRVYSAIATQLDIGGQHRMAYYTMTTSAVLTNFGLSDHTTTAAITAAFTAVGDQSDITALLQLPDGKFIGTSIFLVGLIFSKVQTQLAK